jgi:hypothetical protein
VRRDPRALAREADDVAFRNERPPGRPRRTPRDDGCGIASRHSHRAGLIGIEMQLGGVTFSRPNDHVVERSLASANTTPNVDAIAITETPTRRVAGRKMQMPCRDDHPATQIDAPGRSKERDAANRVGERSACCHGRRNAKHGGIGQCDLELRLGSRWADHADVLEISHRSLHRYGLRGRELARLSQRARNGERGAAKQRARVGLGQVDVTVRNADPDVDGRCVCRPLPR